MPTGYTREQLHTLNEQIYTNAPPELSSHDVNGAIKATDIAMAGTDKQLVADVLVCIQTAGDRSGWWDDELNLIPKNSERLQ